MLDTLLVNARDSATDKKMEHSKQPTLATKKNPPLLILFLAPEVSEKSVGVTTLQLSGDLEREEGEWGEGGGV